MKTLVIDEFFECELISIKQIDSTHYITTVFVKNTKHSFDELVQYYKCKEGRYRLFETVLDMYVEHFPEQIEVKLARNYKDDGFLAEIHHFGPISF